MSSPPKQSTLFEVGITLTLCTAAVFVLWTYAQLAPEPGPPGVAPTDRSTSLIVNHNPFVALDNNTWHLKGSVSNQSDKHFGRIVVKVDLIDEDGEVIGSDHAVLNGDLRLPPGKKWNFKISKAIFRTEESSDQLSMEAFL